MRKTFVILLAFVMTVAFTACGAIENKPEEEKIFATIEAKDCFDDAGFVELISGIKESSEYTFISEDSDAVELCVYILDEAFDDNFRYIKQVAEPALVGDGTIFIDEGQYVYVYCSANEFTTGVVDENAKLMVTAETVDVKNEKATDNGKANVYKEQMDLIYQALSKEWSIDKYFENDISSLISNHYDGNPLENVGYALKDLDGDGKEELLISAVSKDASGGMLYDVYSAPNGKVVHVLSGHERNRYYLQWMEEGAYMIANEASNSAFNSAWYYYSLNAGQLELMQGVVFNAEADEDNPWFLTYDEDWDVSNDTHDEDGIAESIIEAYARSYTTLEYIPFSEFVE